MVVKTLVPHRVLSRTSKQTITDIEITCAATRLAHRFFVRGIRAQRNTTAGVRSIAQMPYQTTFIRMDWAHVIGLPRAASSPWLNHVPRAAKIVHKNSKPAHTRRQFRLPAGWNPALVFIYNISDSPTLKT